MDVCMLVWMYECMGGCVCMDVYALMRMHGICMFVWMHGCIDVWMHTYECMTGYTHVWMDECMDAYVLMCACMDV